MEYSICLSFIMTLALAGPHESTYIHLVGAFFFYWRPSSTLKTFQIYRCHSSVGKAKDWAC